MSEAASKLKVADIVQEFAHDVEMTSEKIAAVVRERIEGVQTSAKSVASVLCNLRKKLGVDAVPHRPRISGNRGETIASWLQARLEAAGDDKPSNKGLANEATEHFGREIKATTIASTKQKLKKAA